MRPYCYFWLSVVLAITFFELAMVENLRMQLETNKFVLLLKLVEAQHVSRVRKNISAIRGLISSARARTVLLKGGIGVETPAPG